MVRLIVVCPSVTDVNLLSLSVRFYGKHSARVIILSRLSAYKIWGMQLKQTISKFRVKWRRVDKMCVLQQKTGHISETVRDTAKVTINHL